MRGINSSRHTNRHWDSHFLPLAHTLMLILLTPAWA